MLKIYNVTWNDGGWHESLPTEMVVASSEKEAKEIANKMHPYRKDEFSYACELKMDGYVIEVYDKKTYTRNKNIEKVLK